jgi:hypothetical protein
MSSYENSEEYRSPKEITLGDYFVNISRAKRQNMNQPKPTTPSPVKTSVRIKIDKTAAPWKRPDVETKLETKVETKLETKVETKLEPQPAFPKNDTVTLVSTPQLSAPPQIDYDVLAKMITKNLLEYIQSKKQAPLPLEEPVKPESVENEKQRDIPKSLPFKDSRNYAPRKKICSHVMAFPNGCTHPSCSFAHNVNEYNPWCNFGSDCFRKDSCGYLHPGEDKLKLSRKQGIPDDVFLGIITVKDYHALTQPKKSEPVLGPAPRKRDPSKPKKILDI